MGPVEIKLTVSLQVDTLDENEEVSVEDAENASLQAIKHAIELMNNAGFVHDMADRLSIGFIDVEVDPTYRLTEHS